MANQDLAAILVKIQERLSNNDRQRLRFFLGDNIPESLRSTLFLILSLIDQENINEEDMKSLINAFNRIQCTDAAEQLQRYMKQIQSNCSTENFIPLLLRGRIPFQSKRKQLFQKMRICSLLSIILSAILIAIVIVGCLMFIQLKTKYNYALNDRMKNDEIIQHLKMIQSVNEENTQLLKRIQSINRENKKDLERTSSNYNETTEESIQSSGNVTSSTSTTNKFDKEDQKFTEGLTCGCQKWCRKNSASPYGVCGNGHTCICNREPITKDNIGRGCTCDGWCKRRGYEDGGICGDGFTCICSK